MKILVFPWDSNPYQDLLYGELEKLGAQVTYLGRLTPSHLLNLLLLPAELVVRRINGAQVVHLHWVWGFSLPGARWLPLMPRVAQIWFGVFLRTIRLLGYRLAWTAHNVLPHSPVFADDHAARRSLVTQCDVVFGHSTWTFASLSDLGAAPRRSVVIQHGPFKPPVSLASMSRSRLDETRKELLFFGKILEYKGVEDLLQAFAWLPQSCHAHLTIAGKCDDPDLRSRVEALAQKAGNRVSLRLNHVLDAEIGPLMGSADVVVLPFRRVTTSGSAILALGHGLPIVIPRLEALAHLPDDAVFRYDGSVGDLAATLRSVISADEELLARKSAAAFAFNSGATWHQTAAITIAELRRVVREAKVCPER